MATGTKTSSYTAGNLKSGDDDTFLWETSQFSLLTSLQEEQWMLKLLAFPHSFHAWQSQPDKIFVCVDSSSQHHLLENQNKAFIMSWSLLEWEFLLLGFSFISMNQSRCLLHGLPSCPVAWLHLYCYIIIIIILSLWPEILLLSLTRLQRGSAVTTQWSKMDRFLSVLAHPKSVTDTRAVINMGTTGSNVEH